MSELLIWPPAGHNKFTLVARFADFYEEVAQLKRAQAEGRLGSYLAGSDAPAPERAEDFARRVSARLLGRLQQQERHCEADAASETGQLERQALYLMAALADEILIFELDWPGRDAWLAVLLEQAMFGTSSAGSRFFAMAGQLLHEHIRSPLHLDLAAVFLLAMELGFKGCWRARQGQPELDSMRARLYQLVAPGSGAHGAAPATGPAFSQAYDYPLRGTRDERLAPISPWRNLGIYGLAGYLLASAVLWLGLMYPFQRYLGS